MNELFIREIANDCAILLARALSDKSVACFGQDGFGLFGQTDRAQTYNIAAFIIRMDSNDDDDEFPEARVIIELEGYNANKFGHILTDQNFKISLNKLLIAEEIRTDCWMWDLVTPQPDNGVILELDVSKLLEWY